MTPVPSFLGSNHNTASVVERPFLSGQKTKFAKVAGVPGSKRLEESGTRLINKEKGVKKWELLKEVLT